MVVLPLGPSRLPSTSLTVAKMKQGETDVDVLIVGAGFGGIYQLYRLREMGLSVKVIDMAGDVGGTWYWNRYPGAMSDSETFVYRFSFDRDDLQTYPWTHHYVKQPDVLAYLEHVVERHDLRRDMQFNTELIAADFDEVSNVWHVELGTGKTLVVRYVVTALGLLSKAHYPAIAGLETFRGRLVHTAAWPMDLDVTGKRVGIIGNGSTGVQVITDIAPRVQSLTSFQRHPQYSVPSGDRPVDPAYRQWVNENYDTIMAQVKASAFGLGFDESKVPFKSVTSAEEREAIWESLWRQGNGFRFMFGGFCDVATDREANEAAADFIRRKISEIVRDPEKARKLQPHDVHARRPLCDSGYFQQFNREHVDVVHLGETPITTITPAGVQTTAGLYELDVLVCATGFDAVEGNYNRIRIHGRSGLSLKDSWDSTGPMGYLGIAVPRFPNLFMITGPQGPFSNLPPAIEAHVELISHLIGRAETLRKAGGLSSRPVFVEATPEALQSWNAECEALAEGSLFKETASWIFGRNIPGKKVALRFFFGGLKKFRDAAQRTIDGGYVGFPELADDSPVSKTRTGAGGAEALDQYIEARV